LAIFFTSIVNIPAPNHPTVGWMVCRQF